MAETSEKLLRDLIEIPDQPQGSEFVLRLSQHLDAAATVRNYVVTPQLTDCFDRALTLIRSALRDNSSEAAYLDGSFGSGKSHFMAVLYAILRHEADAYGKPGLEEVIDRHREWLRDNTFLLVPYHVIGGETLDAVILGGYVEHVRKLHPDKPLPAVYRADQLIADARELRERMGDEQFIAMLPGGGGNWRRPVWDAAKLDAAFAAPAGDDDRRKLVGALLTTSMFQRYTRAVAGNAEAFIPLDEGLSVISTHAKETLGYDAVVLLLDEMVLWLSGLISDTDRVNTEAQKVSKLVESAESYRPAPVISFVPRQRDLGELVGRDVAGAATTTLFDTLKYWDARFVKIHLDDRNLNEIIRVRLLKTKDDAARKELDQAFERTAAARTEVWDALLDAQGAVAGGGAADRDSFRAIYPFSPAFLHAMVDISGALQRQRTALVLMQELLIAYRDILPVGQLMPLGAIFDALTTGGEKPFADKLRAEFEQVQRFYASRLRPHLLRKHNLDDDQARNLPLRHAFRADDLIVKTLLLKALVPGVPALQSLTVSRLAALNYGTIISRVKDRERTIVRATLRELAAEYGEIQVEDGDDPAVDIAIIGVDTKVILEQVPDTVDHDGSRRTLIKSALWEQLGITDTQDYVSRRQIIWRGTRRTVELLFANVRDSSNLSRDEFLPSEEGALRVIIDYPFDDPAHDSPIEDLNRVHELQDELGGEPHTLVWLPHFLSTQRLADLGQLIRIEYLLERDRLTEATPHLTAEDRYHAKGLLENRRANLRHNLDEALRRVYGLNSAESADIGARSPEQLLCLISGLRMDPIAGLGFDRVLPRMCAQLLEYVYPKHPDFDLAGRGKEFDRRDLGVVVRAYDLAVQREADRLVVESKAERDALRRVANPLGVGTMHEQAFLARDDWTQILDRRAAAAGRAEEPTVAELRTWVLGEQPGLPMPMVDLVICCHAMKTDRAWVRAGRVIPAPEPGGLHGEMALRRQALPSSEEFTRAGERARRIFGLKPPPVLTTRATQALATAVGRAAADRLTAVEQVAAALAKHAETLGLNDDAPRLITSGVCADLLNTLAGEEDPTKLVRALANAALPRAPEVAKAHINAASGLASEFASVRWQMLDRLAPVAEGGGDRAGQARTILGDLRAAAWRDEHEAELGRALTTAESDAIELFTDVIRPDTTVVQARVGTPTVTQWSGERTVRLVPAPEVGKVLDELRAAAEEHPDAQFEITWQTDGR